MVSIREFNLKKILSLEPIHYGFGYLLLIIVYTMVFYFNSKGLGLDESFIDSLYLSLVTITTLGFGDITPSTDLGKIVTSSAALFGILMLGLFLNSLSHALSKELIKKDQDEEEKKKERLRESLEMHACLILDVFKSGNPFAWDKHAKYSAPMDELEEFARHTYLTIFDKTKCKINVLHVKLLLETIDQNYDMLLSLAPVAAEISSEHLIAWSSLLSNARNLKQQYQKAQNNRKDETIEWPAIDDIALQVQEIIQNILFISQREKMPD